MVYDHSLIVPKMVIRESGKMICEMVVGSWFFLTGRTMTERFEMMISRHENSIMQMVLFLVLGKTGKKNLMRRFPMKILILRLEKRKMSSQYNIQNENIGEPMNQIYAVGMGL